MAGGNRKAGAGGAGRGSEGRTAGPGAARAMWQGAAGGEDHPALRAYLKARGIKVELLPGGVVPECLRYAEVCPYWAAEEREDGTEQTVRLEDGPAIIARIDGEDGKIATVHRTYLDPGGEPRKRSGTLPDGKELSPRKLLGSSGGGAIRLADPGPDGVLFLTEGTETGLAVLEAMSWVGVWACVSTTGLQRIDLPAGWVDEREGRIRTVIIAGDTDRSDGGRMAAIKAAARLRARWPRLEVGIALPGAHDAPAAFTEGGKLRAGLKGVDWLDVLTGAGAARVAMSLNAESVFRAAPERVLAEADPGALEEARAEGERKAAEDKQILPRGDLERMRVGLEALFGPQKRDDRRWRLAYWAGQWWVRHETASCWDAWPDKSLRGCLHNFYAGLQTYGKGGQPMAFAPTARAIDGILQCAITDVDVASEVMNCWLPETHDEQGKPIPGAATRLNRRKKAEGPIRPQAVIAGQNGLFDSDAFCAGELRMIPHTPRWFSRCTLPYDIPMDLLKEGLADDEAADALCRKLCPTWMWFLEDWTSTLDPIEAAKTVRGLRQYMGYLTTGDNSQETFALMIAPKRGGGGTVFTAVEAVVGEDNCAHASLNDFDGRFDMASVVGVPVMLVAEVDLDGQTRRVIVNERIKSITGGDKFSIEDKYKPKVANIRPSCRIFMRANEMPRLPDPSGATASRLLVFVTTQSYAGREDRTIKAKITAEGQGIMVWSLFGLRDLRKAGRFTMSTAGRAKVAEFERLSAPVMAFVEDMALQQEGSSIVCGALYAAYLEWAEENGHTKPLAASGFGSQLFSCCPRVIRADVVNAGIRSWSYVGIRTKQSGEDRAKPVAPHHVASWASTKKVWKPDRRDGDPPYLA